MKSILIVGDCNIQANIMKEMIIQVIPNVVIYIATDYDYALNISKKHKINLFFLDTILKKRAGIKLAQRLRDYEEYSLTWIVFVSACSQDMLKAFKEVNCYDFIIKPFEKNKIQNIAIKLLGCQGSKLVNKIYYSFDTAENKKVKIKKEDIYFIATENRKCIIHTKIGQYVTQKKSLDTVISEIRMENLIRSHKSFAVNVHKIGKTEKKFSYSEIVFEGYEERALLGRKFKTKIENYYGGIDSKNG